MARMNPFKENPRIVAAYCDEVASSVVESTHQLQGLKRTAQYQFVDHLNGLVDALNRMTVGGKTNLNTRNWRHFREMIEGLYEGDPNNPFSNLQEVALQHGFNEERSRVLTDTLFRATLRQLRTRI